MKQNKTVWCVNMCQNCVCVNMCQDCVCVNMCKDCVCVCEYVYRERGFKELAHVVVEISWVQTPQSRLKTEGRAAFAV